MTTTVRDMVNGIQHLHRIARCIVVTFTTRLLAAAPRVIVHGHALLLVKHMFDDDNIVRFVFYVGEGSLSCEWLFFSS